MIEINLLPPELRRKRKGPILGGKFNLPPEIIIGLGGGLVVLLIFFHIFLMFTNMLRLAQYKGLKKDWEKVLPQKQQVDAIIQELKNLQSKLKSVEEALGSNENLWCRNLNIVSDVLPRGVWLRKLALNEDVFTMEGSAISKKTQERVNIHAFASNLKKEEKFLEYLTNLEIGSIQRRNINKIEIADFSLTAKIK